MYKQDMDVETDILEKSQSEEASVILCASCQNRVTDPDSQITVNESFSHVFANPHGQVFEIGCFSNAPGCIPGSESSDEFSWFPGFVWQVGICQHCAVQLGWRFSSGTYSFFGLILEKLIFP